MASGPRETVLSDFTRGRATNGGINLMSRARAVLDNSEMDARKILAPRADRYLLFLVFQPADDRNRQGHSGDIKVVAEQKVVAA